MLWQMLQLFREYRDREVQSLLGMGSLILEIVGAVAAAPPTRADLPVYAWKLLRDQIHDCFRESLCI